MLPKYPGSTIESGLYRRQGKAIINFRATLPTPQSDLAQQHIKDPYNFDFLTLTSEAQERDLERELLEPLRQFLVELGTGFAFVGSQVPLLKPEYGGKMNFYLAAADDMLRHPDDQPSIGLILCTTKNRIVAEYALRNTTTPMGISEFRHLEKLPEGLIQGGLPTIEEIEREQSQDHLESAEEPE